MSYVAAKRINDTVIVWERDESGRVPHPHKAEFYFYSKDPEGTYKSLYGDTLTKHTFKSSSDLYKAKQKFLIEGEQLFESDIPAELKVLSKKYYNVKAPKLHVTLFDIEVDYDPLIGFSSVTNPYAPINSIAIYNNWENRMLVIAVPPDNYNSDPQDLKQELIKTRMNDVSPLLDDCTVEVELVPGEKDLLIRTLSIIKDSDLLSGWNSEWFDVPYTGRRLLEVLGETGFNKL